MALRIETFDNVRGGNTLYKALSHPHAARAARALVAATLVYGAALTWSMMTVRPTLLRRSSKSNSRKRAVT